LSTRFCIQPTIAAASQAGLNRTAILPKAPVAARAYRQATSTIAAHTLAMAED